MDALKDELCRVIETAASFPVACRTAVNLLARQVPHYNWVGIYLRQGDELVLSAWTGPEATEHVRIPVGQGICGLAAHTGETVIVDDVNADPRYLACFPHTRAEIVVPIHRDGEVIGEIDVDSDQQAAFSVADQALLEGAAALLGRKAPPNAV